MFLLSCLVAKQRIDDPAQHLFRLLPGLVLNGLPIPIEHHQIRD
jgi:hypothetical protein